MEDNSLTYNPQFDNLEKDENAELRFFCEAFSVIDAINNSNLLLGFSTQVSESKDGKIKWNHIPDLFPDGIESANYISSIARVGELIEKVVRKGWVTPMRTRSLSDIAAAAHRHHKNDSKSLLEHGSDQYVKQSPVSGIIINRSKTLANAWKEISINLMELTKFQDEYMNYHADFQKENYLPHPNSWKVYTGTFAIIFATLLYSIL